MKDWELEMWEERFVSLGVKNHEFLRGEVG